MITVVKQDRDLRNADGFRSKVVQMVNQHLNQALIIGDIRFGAVREKRDAECIDRQMPLDAVGAFVVTESIRLAAGSAGIFHGL